MITWLYLHFSFGISQMEEWTGQNASAKVQHTTLTDLLNIEAQKNNIFCHVAQEFPDTETHLGLQERHPCIPCESK